MRPSSFRFDLKWKRIDRGWHKLRTNMRALAESDAYSKVGVIDESKPRQTVRPRLVPSFKAWSRMSDDKRQKIGLGNFVRWKKASTRSEKKKGGGPAPTNAQIAAWNEFGAPARGIPERSFIRSTFYNMRAELIERSRKLVAGIYRGTMDIERALNILGATLAYGIKKRITSGAPIPPQNSPATIRRKTEKGLHTSKSGGMVRTLIDTGQMVAAITWSVVLGFKARNKPGGGSVNALTDKPKG